MTPGDFTARLTIGICLVAGAIAVPAAWLFGASAGVGVLVGGALAVADFRWLVARAMSALGQRRAGWLAGASLRFVVLLGACAFFLASGLAHPLALLLGFSALPCLVVAQGLRAARRAA